MASRARDLAQHAVHVGHLGGANPEVDKTGGAKYIGVSLVGSNLSPWQQKNVVKVGLQFTFGVVVRLGVVVGDGDKVEPARHRGFDGQKKWARNLLSHPALAGPIAMCSMHVQVTAIPGGSGPDAQAEQWVLSPRPGRSGRNRPPQQTARSRFSGCWAPPATGSRYPARSGQAGRRASRRLKRA